MAHFLISANVMAPIQSDGNELLNCVQIFAKKKVRMPTKKRAGKHIEKHRVVLALPIVKASHLWNKDLPRCSGYCVASVEDR